MAKVHLIDFTIGGPPRALARCGRLVDRKAPNVTKELGEVSCLLCRRGGEEDYASQRDGIDYQRRRWHEARDRAADRAAAARIVVDRHREEYEMELALLVLARMGREAAPLRSVG